MRKVLIASLMTVLMFGLVACGGNNTNNDNAAADSVAVVDIMTAIKEKMAEIMEADYGEDYLDEDGTLLGYVEADLVGETDDDINEIFLEQIEIDATKLAAGQFLAPMMNVNADQVIILQAKDAKEIDALKASLEKEQERQIGIWEQYLPDQYEKVKNNIITTKGNYLLFATFSDAKALEAVFQEQLN